MIFKSKPGTGITGTLRYIEGPGKDENGVQKAPNGRAHLLGGQNFGLPIDNPHRLDIARRLMEQNGRPEMQGDKTHYTAKDALHISLSWAPGQTPDDDEMRTAAREALEALGMGSSMAVFHKHTDRSYSHLHILASNIDPATGLAFDGFQRRYRGMHWAVEWERAHDQVVKNREKIHQMADASRGANPDHEALFDILIKNEATIPRWRAEIAFAVGGHFGADLNTQMEQFVSENDLIRLRRYQNGPIDAYTTREIWREENRILGIARRLADSKGHGIPENILNDVADKMTLTAEQRTVLHAAGGDSGLAIIVGEAGTGKSWVGRALRMAHEQAGRTYKGAAFTNKVVQGFHKDGTDAATLAAERLLQKGGNANYSNTVIQLEEAGQISTPDLDVMRAIERDGGKVVLTGDSEQLGSIERGGLFDILVRRHGASELREIMRNRDPDQKRAFNLMHDRKWKKAVDIFNKSGSIVWNDTKGDSINALLEQYQQDGVEHPGDRQLIIAATNEEVDALNQIGRKMKRDAGQLQGRDYVIDTNRGPAEFAVGDRILMTETPNKEDKKRGLINGAFGNIAGLRMTPDLGHEMTVQIDGPKDKPPRFFTFPVGTNKEAGEVAGIRHGDASTVYKSQGDTIPRIYAVHNPLSMAPSNYVEMSRHSKTARLYVTREETPSYEDIARQLGHGNRKTSAHHYLVDERDRAKLMARESPPLAPQHGPDQPNHGPDHGQDQPDQHQPAHEPQRPGAPPPRAPEDDDTIPWFMHPASDPANSYQLMWQNRPRGSQFEAADGRHKSTEAEADKDTTEATRRGLFRWKRRGLSLER